MNELLEKLAELEHEQWVAWSKALDDTETLSDKRMERWVKLWVPYSELSEKDKEFDREWARKVFRLYEEYFIKE